MIAALLRRVHTTPGLLLKATARCVRDTHRSQSTPPAQSERLHYYQKDHDDECISPNTGGEVVGRRCFLQQDRNYSCSDHLEVPIAFSTSSRVAARQIRIVPSQLHEAMA